MYNGIKVIDADGHVMEPNEFYDQYLDRKYKPDLEELKKFAATRPSKWFFGYFHQLNTGRPLGIANRKSRCVRGGRQPKGEQPNMRGGLNPYIRIKDMDREGIDVAVVFATVVSSFCALKTVEFELAMIRAYHRWLADYCSAYPNRLKGVAVVPMRAAELAARKSIAWRKSRGASASIYRGIWRTSSSTIRSSVPFGKRAREADLPACFHGGTARPPYGCGTFEFGNNLFIQHSATNPFEVMRAIAAFVGGGVLDMYPELRVAMLEAGADGCRSGWSGSMSTTS